MSADAYRETEGGVKRPDSFGKTVLELRAEYDAYVIFTGLFDAVLYWPVRQFFGFQVAIACVSATQVGLHLGVVAKCTMSRVAASSYAKLETSATIRTFDASRRGSRRSPLLQVQKSRTEHSPHRGGSQTPLSWPGHRNPHR